MPPADRKNRASATDAVATDEEFPFDRETASVEEKQLANAVARGKMVLWPVTFVATLAIGVGCSGGGIVKTRGWNDRFYFWIFVATLAGWGVLLVIQGIIMNELYTQRKKSRNAKVIVALALAFGGWVSGYFLAILAIYLIWRPTEPEGSGANALLMVQAILGVGGSLVGLWLYFQGYVKPVRAVPAHLEDKSNIKTPARQLSQAVSRRFSRSSAHSSHSRRSGPTSDSGSRSKKPSTSKSSTAESSRTRVAASKRSETDSASSGSDTSTAPIRSSRSNPRSASRPGKTAVSTRGKPAPPSSRNIASDLTGSSDTDTDASARTDMDDDQHQLLAKGSGAGSPSPDAHRAASSSGAVHPNPSSSYPPLPPPPQSSSYPPSGASAPQRLTVPVRIQNGAQTVYTGNWDLDAQKYIP